MKAMFVSDLVVVRSYLGAVAVFAFVEVLFFLTVDASSTPGLVVFMNFSLPFLGIVAVGAGALFSTDERRGWEQLRASLPLSRANIVLGRYASMAAVALAALVVSSALLLAMAAAANALSQFAPFAKVAQIIASGFSWEELLAEALLMLAAVLVMVSFVVPFVMRLGIRKGHLAAAVPFVLIFCVAPVAVGGFDVGGLGTALEGQFDRLDGALLLIASGIACAIGVVLYLVSAAVSVLLYAKRDL